MKINQLRLKNFKSIGDKRQFIDFSDITMLFGANSVGKSTVIQSLIYLYEILCKGNLDPDKTDLGGESVDLGGFRNLVHMRDLNKEIEIGVRFKLESGDSLLSYTSRLEDDLITEHGYEEARDFLYEVHEFVLTLSIAWSERLQKVMVSSYTLTLEDPLDIADDEDDAIENPLYVTSILCSADGKMIELKGIPFTPYTLQSQLDNRGDYEPLRQLHEVLNSLIPDVEHEMLRQNVLSNRIASNKALDEEVLSWKIAENHTFALMGQKDALPLLSGLKIGEDNWREGLSEEDEAGIVAISAILNTAISGTLMLATRWLENFIYIGPLREVPSRAIEPSPKTPNSSRWSKGLSAWEQLHSFDDKQIATINQWLGRDALQTGYQIDIKRYRELEENHALYTILNSEPDLDELLVIQSLLDEIPVKTRIALLEEQSDLEVVPTDIGVGISQLFPIVVLASIKKSGLAAIEQPELHIHPKLQTELAELFISAKKNQSSQFLLETHSEHLILRLLRRIREGENDSKLSVLLPKDVAVNYVARGETGAEFTRLPITEDGDFEKKWPEGFFDERDQELFY
jgi:predicted ATPase